MIVGLPDNNPLALPFAHKKLFSERVDHYDLFIYSEDDILITKRNIEAFLAVAHVLPDHKVAGFIRSEVGSAGDRYYDPLLSSFHWDAESVVEIGGYTFAFFTNQHSGCFMLTLKQLRCAIASGGFLVGPHEREVRAKGKCGDRPLHAVRTQELVCVSHVRAVHRAASACQQVVESGHIGRVPSLIVKSMHC